MTFVYDFDEHCDGGRALLGGKGLGLAEMTQLGLPVPSGFTVTTEACRVATERGKLPAAILDEMLEHVHRLEARTGKRFGSETNPLLLSVRSGGPISMPGMMETVLNLGMNRATARGIARATGDKRFAFDAYRRLLQMYGSVVADIDNARFEHAIERLKERRRIELDSQLTASDFIELAGWFEEIFRDETAREFPTDPREQLVAAAEAVFASWDAPRARVYRHEYRIDDDLGTAVNVMEMVFGNRDARSATGVCFSRSPATGEPGLFGEFLVDAQGEDVVAGTRTPEPIGRMKELFPVAYDELEHAVAELERHYRDMQDVEFTIEHDRLYLLQTRSAKRTAAAALRAAVAFVEEGLIGRRDAVGRIEPAAIEQLLHPAIDPAVPVDVAAVGLAASPGAACGAVVFDADDAVAAAEERDVILVRPETTADDIHGLIGAVGVLTARGGMTSHAAVVARGMGKPCVAGCGALHVDLENRTAGLGDHVLLEGDVITIDGTTGRVLLGAVPLVEPEPNADFQLVLQWADEARVLGVRANADTPEDALRSRQNGAEGIGLCRTEHMFMAEDRLPVVRQMILASTDEERAAALARLLPMQQRDFEGIFEAMTGLPVTIRLLDPPLHEFLPPLEEIEDEQTRERVAALHEANPMLGTRGCRLGLQWPGIYEMQVRAIARAARAVESRTGIAPRVEIMHPLVAFEEELSRLQELTARTVAEEGGIPYLCGTMIELPRAALRAGDLARHADFFSFGTNDLTQTALGFSRDDAQGRFLTYYLEHGVLPVDPFATLDIEGVGELIRIAVERGRLVNADLHVGVCGEHGGDPASIEFCHEVGLDYVSCSPFRVPVARLAAGQAALADVNDTAYVPAGG
ncbi:MAG: pyruvate, phosphate dikinase [Gaiellaceae bacterium]